MMQQRGAGLGAVCARLQCCCLTLPVVAAAATPAIPPIAPTPSEWAAGTFFARARDVNGQGTAFEFGAVQGLDGRLSRFVGSHCDESESAGPSGGPVQHQVSLGDRPMGGKHVQEVAFRHFKTQVTDKQFILHDDLFAEPLPFYQTGPDRRVSNHH
jgi:hypothetical protein